MLFSFECLNKVLEGKICFLEICLYSYFSVSLPQSHIFPQIHFCHHHHHEIFFHEDHLSLLSEVIINIWLFT